MKSKWMTCAVGLLLGFVAVGCDKKEGAKDAVGTNDKPGKKTSKPEPSAAKSAAPKVEPAWVDKLTADKYKAFIEANECDCSVTETKKDGDVEVIRWQIHKPGEESFQSYVTTVTSIANKAEGDALARELTTKFKTCVGSEVGNTVMVSTRLLMKATAGMQGSEYVVEECTTDSPSEPTGLQEFVEH